MSIVGPYRRTDVGDVGGGQFTRVEPSGEFLESPNFEALRTRENLANFSYFFVMLELGKLTHPSGDMELPLLFLLRPVWFFWFLCQGYHSWRMGLTKISQIHLKSLDKKFATENSQSWNSQAPRWLSSPLKLRGVNSGLSPLSGGELSFGCGRAVETPGLEVFVKLLYRFWQRFCIFESENQKTEERSEKVLLDDVLWRCRDFFSQNIFLFGPLFRPGRQWMDWCWLPWQKKTLRTWG